MRPVITGLGRLSAEGLAPGQRSEQPFTRPDWAQRPLGMVPPFKLKQFVKTRLGRRMEGFGKLMVAACAQALAERLSARGTRVGLAAATDIGPSEATAAYLRRLRDLGPRLANPLAFPNLLPGAAAGWIGMVFDLQGPTLTFVQHELGPLLALEWAWEQLETSPQVDGMLVVAGEDLGPALIAARRRIYRGRARRTEGAGAGALLLERSGSGPRLLGLGFGQAIDGGFAEPAVAWRALQDAGVEPASLTDLWLPPLPTTERAATWRGWWAERLPGVTLHDIAGRCGYLASGAALALVEAAQSLQTTAGRHLVLGASRDGAVGAAVLGGA